MGGEGGVLVFEALLPCGLSKDVDLDGQTFGEVYEWEDKGVVRLSQLPLEIQYEVVNEDCNLQLGELRPGAQAWTTSKWHEGGGHGHVGRRWTLLHIRERTVSFS